ncbi:MAG TPA: hypothetical protein PLF63_09840, partial [Rubrivivax sp.]|nr:hypothetical protein [Rubrivivax sp.]
FATRLAAILGPLTYGLITALAGGNHRLAIVSTGLFFAVGLLLLRPLDMRRGAAAAQAHGQAVQSDAAAGRALN